MKEIGKGLQFTVYDLENGRVLKIPNSIDDMKKILIKWNPSLLINSKDLNEKIDYYLVLTEKSMVGIKNSNINLEILGNPIFLDDNKIEQDKVKMISDCLQGEIDNQKKVIDEFIILTIESWKNGFSDIVFNLKINSGIDKNGKAILSDFGELTFDKEIVKSRMKYIAVIGTASIPMTRPTKMPRHSSNAVTAISFIGILSTKFSSR